VLPREGYPQNRLAHEHPLCRSSSPVAARRRRRPNPRSQRILTHTRAGNHRARRAPLLSQGRAVPPPPLPTNETERMGGTTLLWECVHDAGHNPFEPRLRPYRFISFSAYLPFLLRLKISHTSSSLEEGERGAHICHTEPFLNTIRGSEDLRHKKCISMNEEESKAKLRDKKPRLVWKACQNEAFCDLLGSHTCHKALPAWSMLRHKELRAEEMGKEK